MIAYVCTFIGGQQDGQRRTLARTSEFFQEGSIVPFGDDLYEVSQLRGDGAGQASCTMTYRGIAPDPTAPRPAHASEGDDVAVPGSVLGGASISESSLKGDLVLWVQAGVAVAKAWPALEVIACEELPTSIPSGPPLVVVGEEIDLGQSRAVAALRGAGREVLVVTAQRPSPEVLSWLDRAWVHLAEPFAIETSEDAGGNRADLESAGERPPAGDAVSDAVQLQEAGLRQSEPARNPRDKFVGEESTGSAPSAASLSPDLRDLLKRARTRVLPFLDGSEAAATRKLIAAVEDASPGAEQRSAAKALEDSLAEYSYLF